jgi:hypothetical protein
MHACEEHKPAPVNKTDLKQQPEQDDIGVFGETTENTQALRSDGLSHYREDRERQQSDHPAEQKFT